MSSVFYVSWLPCLSSFLELRRIRRREDVASKMKLPGTMDSINKGFDIIFSKFSYFATNPTSPERSQRYHTTNIFLMWLGKLPAFCRLSLTDEAINKLLKNIFTKLRGFIASCVICTWANYSSLDGGKNPRPFLALPWTPHPPLVSAVVVGVQFDPGFGTDLLQLFSTSIFGYFPSPYYCSEIVI